MALPFLGDLRRSDLNCFTSVHEETGSFLILDFICLWFLKLRKGCVPAVGNHYMLTSATVRLRKICKINGLSEDGKHLWSFWFFSICTGDDGNS